MPTLIQPQERTTGGDNGGVEAAFLAHAERLRRYINNQLGDPHLAEEIVQETFVRVLRHRERLETGNSRNWVTTIATNLMIDARRRRSRENYLADTSERELACALPDRSPETLARTGNEYELLAGLNERFRRILEARYLHGESPAEVAAAECISASAAKSLMSRAREGLRAALAALEASASQSTPGGVKR